MPTIPVEEGHTTSFGRSLSELYAQASTLRIEADELVTLRGQSERLEAALAATRRDDIDHGTNAAYIKGCVCSDCRTHQRIRMARNR